MFWRNQECGKISIYIEIVVLIIMLMIILLKTYPMFLHMRKKFFWRSALILPQLVTL